MKKCYLFLCLSIITICCAYILYTLLESTPPNTVISWGLVPNNQEQTPAPVAAGLKLLQEHNGIFVGNTQTRSVYFTFDLGSESG